MVQQNRKQNKAKIAMPLLGLARKRYCAAMRVYGCLGVVSGDCSSRRCH